MYMSAEETIRANVAARTLVFKSQVRAACRTLTQQGKGSLRPCLSARAAPPGSEIFEKAGQDARPLSAHTSPCKKMLGQVEGHGVTEHPGLAPQGKI